MLAQSEKAIQLFEFTKAEAESLLINKPKDTVFEWRDIHFKHYLSFVHGIKFSLQVVTREMQPGEEKLSGVTYIPRKEVIEFLTTQRLVEQTYYDRKKIPPHATFSYLPAITLFEFIQICEKRKMSNKEITKLLPKSADLIFDKEISKKIISLIRSIKDLDQCQNFCNSILNDVDHPYGYLLKLSSKKPIFGKSDEEKEVIRILQDAKFKIAEREKARRNQLERENELKLERERANSINAPQALAPSLTENTEKQLSGATLPKPKQPQYPAGHARAKLAAKEKNGEYDDECMDLISALVDEQYLEALAMSEILAANQPTQPQQTRTRSSTHSVNMALNLPREDKPQEYNQEKRSLSARGAKPQESTQEKTNLSTREAKPQKSNQEKNNLNPPEVKSDENNEGTLNAIYGYARYILGYDDSSFSEDLSQQSESEDADVGLRR